MIELFQVPGAKSTAPEIAALPSPFGDIRLIIELGDDIVGNRVDECWTIPSGTRVLVWSNELLRAELLLGAVTVDLPPGMAVSACHAAVWRLRAHLETPSCRFIANWDAAARPPSHGNPSSGQGLAAQYWDDGVTTVELGTADAESLSRCVRGWQRPESWSSLLSVDDPTALTIEQYRRDGLAIDLPGIAAGEGGQIHFAAAWAPTWSNDSATWYAVDLNPERVASMLGAA